MVSLWETSSLGIDIFAPKLDCYAVAHPDVPTTVLSIFIVFGILFSYIPQHARIISRRSSEGLSPYFVLLGITSSTFAIFNILTLPKSQEDIACCKEINGFACVAAMLGIAQVAVQWSCFGIILFLFLIFFPTPGPEHVASDPSIPTWKDALGVVTTAIGHFFVILLVSVVISLSYPSHLQSWATLLGLGAALLACIQYIPQLYTTWRLQHVMSLSIPMMCIQTPGSFVFAASLAMRLGVEGWSAWGVYIVTGILQGCLLLMGLKFEIRDMRERERLAGLAQRSNGEEEIYEEEFLRQGSAADEHTSLLGNGNGNGNGHSPAEGAGTRGGPPSYASMASKAKKPTRDGSAENE
ncbi:pq loop repeat protein [Venturia nashicola]|nr:pq loop repeat protein [Venturia nashicola]